MTPFVVLAVLLAVTTAAMLTRPLWWRGSASAEAVKAPLGLIAALAAFVLALGAGGYAALGSPDRLAAEPPTVQAAPSPALGQLSAVVDQLAAHVKAQPGDAKAWQMLASAYATLQRHADAVAAYRTALQLQPRDATLTTDLAFAIAMANQRRFAGEPAALVERALALEPNNPKALALAGTVAFDRKDYEQAVHHWERLAQAEPADGPFAQQIAASIAQARQLAAARAAPAPVVDKPAAPAAPARITGTVSLAPALKSRVSPGDTLFVFARAAEGPRMPLAILRKQVKDLPLEFTLDDSLSMSPAAKLSGASRVIVGARISKSGQAMPQPGDLQVLSAPVPLPTTGLVLTIETPVPREP